MAGTKLHLTVKKAEPRNYLAEDEKAREKLIAQLRICLKPHFVPNDVEKIVEQFSQVRIPASPESRFNYLTIWRLFSGLVA